MIKRYGLLIGLLMVSASVLAMEEEEPPAAAAASSSAVEAAPVAKQPAVWGKIGSALLWPFRPFEVVDRNDEIRKKYKDEILANWDDICKRPENYDALSEQQKKLVDYKQNKFQHIRDSKDRAGADNPDVLPTRNEILIWKYDYKCEYTRWIHQFLHGSPYSYFASGLYYCALATGGWKGAQKIRKLLRDRKDYTSSKNGEEKLKNTTVHSDCAWCKARKEMNVRNHTVEESI